VAGLGEDVDPKVLYDHDRALTMIYAAKPIDGHGRTAAVKDWKDCADM
jgi:hypothetical protein